MDPLDVTHFHSVIRAGAASLPREPEMRSLSLRSYGFAFLFHLGLIGLFVAAALLHREATPPISIEVALLMPGITTSEPQVEAQPSPPLPPPPPVAEPEAPRLFNRHPLAPKPDSVTSKTPVSKNPDEAGELGQLRDSDSNTLQAGQQGKSPLPQATSVTSPRQAWQFSNEQPKLANLPSTTEAAQRRLQNPPPPEPLVPTLDQSTTTPFDQPQNTQNTPVPNSGRAAGPASDHISAPKSSGLGTVLVAPLPYYRPKPVYPPAAIKQGISGRTLVRLLVGANGEIIKATISQSSGSAILDEAARQAVLKWKFTPGREASGQVVTAVDVPIEFSLENANGGNGATGAAKRK